MQNLYRWASDILVSFIFVMGLCKADMTSADRYAYFCGSDLRIFQAGGFRKVLSIVIYCKHFVANFHILDILWLL